MLKGKLTEAGLTAEQAERIASVIKENYTDNAKFNEISERLKTAEGELKKRDSQLEELKKANPESLKEEIKKLQNENKANAENYRAELNKMKIDSAVEIALINSKAKNTKAVRALLNLENAELDESGGVKGLKKQIDELVKNESYLFNTENKTEPAGLKGVKAAEGRSETPTADVTKMNYEELCRYMEANPTAQI